MLIIGVAGGTGSGKTTVVHKIMQKLAGEAVSVLAQDSYYKSLDQLSYQERCAINFDHPDSVDFDLLIEHVKQLKQGYPVEQPVYSFNDHKRSGESIKVFPPKVLILEGILLFSYKMLRELCDIKIFVHVDSDQRLIRRLRRDMAERGRDLEEVLERYQNSLKPMHEEFIEPTMKYADIIIPTHKSNGEAIDLLSLMIRQKMGS